MAAGTRRPPGARLVVGMTLVALSVGGFVFGLFAGTVWEEPGLVLGFLSGGTEEVAWDRAPAPDPLPDVAAPVAAEVSPAEKAPPPVPVGLRVAAAPPSAPAGRIAVQVGAFAESSSAEALAKRLTAKGYASYVSPGATGKARWRVRVGPLASREEGERTAARLKREERLPTWVLSED